MKVLVAVAVISVLIAVWVVWIRPWARPQPSWRWFFEAVEPIEIFLWRKSETILFARFKMFVGILLTTLTQFGSIDLTPLMPFVPDEYEPMLKLAFNSLPMIIFVLGIVDEKLRKDTTKPLEIVELPSSVPVEVADALAKADEAKVEAVAAAATMPDVPADTPLVKVE